MASEHAQEFSLILWDWEKPHTGAFITLGKANAIESVNNRLEQAEETTVKYKTDDFKLVWEQRKTFKNSEESLHELWHTIKTLGALFESQKEKGGRNGQKAYLET